MIENNMLATDTEDFWGDDDCADNSADTRLQAIMRRFYKSGGGTAQDLYESIDDTEQGEFLVLCYDDMCIADRYEFDRKIMMSWDIETASNAVWYMIQPFAECFNVNNSLHMSIVERVLSVYPKSDFEN